MRTAAARPIEDCLLDLFRHLGIERAHIVAGGPPPLRDWQNLATLHPERIASLTLISPPNVDSAPLAGLASRMLVFAGDQGRLARGAAELTASDQPNRLASRAMKTSQATKPARIATITARSRSAASVSRAMRPSSSVYRELGKQLCPQILCAR